MSSNKANIIAVLGASGSGKSRSVKEILRKKPWPRLMIWDMMREYGEFAAMTDNENVMIDLLSKAGKRGPFAVAFNCEKENRKKRERQFHTFCGIAYSLGCTALIDELKFVTSPQWAPDRWSMISSTGRHEGMTVIGMSQRPAQIDKDFLGNCTVIRTFRLGYPDDRTAVAKAMDINAAEIAALGEYEFIEKDLNTHEITKGKMPW